MALLGTFINAGVMCLPAGAGCIAHGLPTTPDFSTWMPRNAGAAAGGVDTGVVVLVTANATALVFSANNVRSGEVFSAVFHSVIR